MNSAVLFLENTAKSHSGRIALKDEAGSITYAQLRGKARGIGTALLSLHPKLENSINPVLVLMKKSLDAVTAFMGVLYSGNPYVPLDYEIPMSRLEKILENLSPGFIITDEHWELKLKETKLAGTKVLVFSGLMETKPNDSLVDQAISLVLDSDPIYIKYTSGSTGIPKGVVIPHRGVVDFAMWVVKTFDIDPETVMGNQAPLYFDNSVLDIYGAFAAGATLVLIPPVLFMFPNKIPEYINEVGITSIYFVPTVLINIANSGILSEVAMPNLKKVLFCGEVMPNKQLNIWRKNHPDALYANLYGPTEITDVCTYYIIDKEYNDTDPLPIGKPCENMNVLILTEDNKLAEPGETGQLCVTGSGVALGYWGAEEIMRKVFVRNPLNPYYEERMYLTGDLAFWGDDGLIHFIGRMDSQIKLGGNRIELGEIETAVKSIEGIENAAVLFDAEKQEIVVFIQSLEQMKLHKLKRQLLALIPSYMVPSRMKVMEKLPLTPNAKIDRVTLKQMIQAE
jgi:amino acid adenylation domain-containing protein